MSLTLRPHQPFIVSEKFTSSNVPLTVLEERPRLNCDADAG
jgi:hypothetical protein